MHLWTHRLVSDWRRPRTNLPDTGTDSIAWLLAFISELRLYPRRPVFWCDSSRLSYYFEVVIPPFSFLFVAIGRIIIIHTARVQVYERYRRVMYWAASSMAIRTRVSAQKKKIHVLFKVRLSESTSEFWSHGWWFSPQFSELIRSFGPLNSLGSCDPYEGTLVLLT